MSRHDCKIVGWNIKHQHKQNARFTINTNFLCRIMIFLSICSSDTCLFRPQWRHNPYKYFDFCGVEPMNAVCTASTATSDVLNCYTTEASPKKKAQVGYIKTPDAAVHSVIGVLYYSIFLCRIMIFLSICSSDTCLF